MTTPDPTTQPAPGDRVLIEAVARELAGLIRLVPLALNGGLREYAPDGPGDAEGGVERDWERCEQEMADWIYQHRPAAIGRARPHEVLIEAIAEAWRENGEVRHQRNTLRGQLDAARIAAGLHPNGREDLAEAVAQLRARGRADAAAGDVDDDGPDESLAMALEDLDNAIAERDAAYARGRADAAAALRHTAEQMPWIAPGARFRAGDLQHRIIDWAAEVAERGEVPGNG